MLSLTNIDIFLRVRLVAIDIEYKNALLIKVVINLVRKEEKELMI